MLYILQVGHNDASDRYIRNKVKAVEEAGLQAAVVNLDEECGTVDVILAIADCGEKEDCTAIMVQLPLPSHLDKRLILETIPRHMDIDGLNPYSDYVPLTPSAIMRWFDEQKVDLAGQKVAILGRSELVGKPLANLMIDAGATVTIMNSKTGEAFKRNICSQADIIISAVGKRNVVGLDDVAGYRKQIVVDVGINRNSEGKLCGDVAPVAKEMVENNGGVCTPVPGGVGKWTVQEVVLRLKEMEEERRGINLAE